MTDDALFAALWARRHLNTSPMGTRAEPQPVLTPAQEAASLAALVFRPPELQMRVYREVANGGYGPGYGVLGLLGLSPVTLRQWFQTWIAATPP